VKNIVQRPSSSNTRRARVCVCVCIYINTRNTDYCIRSANINPRTWRADGGHSAMHTERTKCADDRKRKKRSPRRVRRRHVLKWQYRSDGRRDDSAWLLSQGEKSMAIVYG